MASACCQETLNGHLPCRLQLSCSWTLPCLHGCPSQSSSQGPGPSLAKTKSRQPLLPACAFLSGCTICSPKVALVLHIACMLAPWPQSN